MTTAKMPVLFVGHGSPINALADNAFTRALTALGNSLPRPKAVAMVSAHWMTRGTWVTAMEHPQTIHDFAGFPDPLFQIQYAAPGAPWLAQRIAQKISGVQLDAANWGLDHGAWAVLKFLYPQADVPVVQISYDPHQPASHHFELGKQLAFLRDEGVLLMGSGNLVHNLRKIQWQADAPAYDWATEFDGWAADRIQTRDVSALVQDYAASEAGKLSVPTPDHYYPFLYILGASADTDRLSFPYAGLENGSISMRSVLYTAA